MSALNSTSPVRTNEEAVRFLRLDEDYSQMADAIRALHRLVREGGLKPLRVGKSYKFTLAELERFVAAEVGPSDPETDDDGDSR